MHVLVCHYCLTSFNSVYRVTNAIKQGMYLLEDSSEEAEQECVFGLPDCASDGWQNQMEEIHMVCPVVTIASILHHMRPATGVSSIYDPSNVDDTDGVLEIKCPYSM